MIPLIHEENNFYNGQEVCYIWKETFCTDKNDKSYINKRKVLYCHYIGKFRGAPKEIPIIIHNDSYDTHFTLNQLAIESKSELNCIGDNMEKYIT